MHVVMGIASLENCAVQITSRDDYIGWMPNAFTNKLKTLVDIEEIRAHFKKLLAYLEDGIKGVDYEDLCSEVEIIRPSEDTVKNLQYQAAAAEEERQRLLRLSQNEEDNDASEEKSEPGSPSKTPNNTSVALRRYRSFRTSRQPFELSWPPT